jgi:hypothetical protein
MPATKTRTHAIRVPKLMTNELNIFLNKLNNSERDFHESGVLVQLVGT